MRSIALLILCTLQGAAAGAGGEPPSAKAQWPCESRSLGGDHRDFKCPLVVSATARHFRFKADFSGGHDDTSARMTATLDGAPLSCEKGSKASLFGEDGDVYLECRFSIAEEAGSKHILGVTLLWSHAQYAGFEVSAE